MPLGTIGQFLPAHVDQHQILWHKRGMRSLVMLVVLLPMLLLTFACATLGDKDKDGIKRRDDKCPEAAEDKDGVDDLDGCPEDDQGNITAEQAPREIEAGRRGGGGDRDGDGTRDDVDACPDDPEDFDSSEDDDGCPDPDNDRDGSLDVDDQCPNEPEDKDGFADEDGCPDADNDADGVPDSMDRCPTESGTNGGCP